MRVRIFDGFQTLILGVPEPRSKPESLREGTFADALELAYWRFDGRRAGNGKWAMPDGTKRPMSERDAFKTAVCELLAEREIKER